MVLSWSMEIVFLIDLYAEIESSWPRRRNFEGCMDVSGRYVSQTITMGDMLSELSMFLLSTSAFIRNLHRRKMKSSLFLN